MTNEFSVLNLHPQLVQAVAERGYQTPMPIQSAVIPLMLEHRDVIGQAQTGTGKTAAFALPLLHNLQPGLGTVQSLVLVPTRELALQVSEFITEYGRYSNVRVLAVYGGAPYSPQLSALRRGVDVVVGTPGRLMDLMRRGALNIQHIHTVVLDEADEMLSMGFAEDIQTILAETPAERQTALFSATMPPEIRRLAESYMRDPQPVTIRREQLTGEGIDQRYYVINEMDKTAALTRLFEVEDISSALIFVRTRARSSDLANELTGRGFPAEALNGDLNQEARERTLNRFRQNKIVVLVATDIAARGLDIDDISHVINYDMPDDPDAYVHRIGRTGRAGKTGIAITLVSPFERRGLRHIEGMTRRKLTQMQVPTEEEIHVRRQQRLVNQMRMWLQRGRCKQERALVESLVEEGFDALEVATAALKMSRAEEKQRPIAPMSEVVEPQPLRSFRPERPAGRPYGRDSRGQGEGREPRGRFPQDAVTSHEPGMVRLSLNLGRKHGIRPNDIVGAIAAHAKIPGYAIGKIHIHDRLSLVDVPEGMVAQVLEVRKDVRIRKLPVELERA